MKKLFCLTSVFLAAVSMFSDPAKAKEQWVKVGESVKDNIFYVDTNSIEGQERFRYYWQHIQFNSPMTDLFERPAYGVLSYESVDCQTRDFRDRTVIWVDQDGKTIREKNYGDNGELQRVNTATIQAAVLQYVCTY